MRAIWKRLLDEPAMLYALAEVGIAALLAFGTELTGEQVAAILGIVAVLTGIGTRQAVVPTRKLERRRGPQFNPEVEQALGRGRIRR